MIFTDRTITVRKGESRIDEPIVVYRGDYELEVRFTILNSKFRFMSGTNLIESEKASYGQLAILTPYGGNIFSDIMRCNEGSVTFVLTAEMLNQIEEVGLYSFQIRLMDYNKESRVSIPPIEFGIEVREPIASEDHDNSVNNAIVGYSIAKVVDPKEEKVGDTFDEDGNYNKTKWETGDRISEGKLNKIEDAIDKINKNEVSNAAVLNRRIDNNFNVLDSIIESELAQTNAQLSQIANKGTTVEVLERVTKEEINRQIADGTIVNLIIQDNSITSNKLALNAVSNNSFSQRSINYLTPSENLIINFDENNVTINPITVYGAFEKVDVLNEQITYPLPQTDLIYYLTFNTQTKKITHRFTNQYMAEGEYILVAIYNKKVMSMIGNCTVIGGVSESCKKTINFVEPSSPIIVDKENGTFVVKPNTFVLKRDNTFKFIKDGVYSFNTEGFTYVALSEDGRSLKTIPVGNEKYIVSKDLVLFAFYQKKIFTPYKEKFEIDDRYATASHTHKGVTITPSVVLNNYLGDISKKTRIKILGDSITAGVGGTGYALTEEQINSLTFDNQPKYKVSEDGYCWANLLIKNIRHNFNDATRELTYKSEELIFSDANYQDTMTWHRLDRGMPVGSSVEFEMFGNDLKLQSWAGPTPFTIGVKVNDDAEYEISVTNPSAFASGVITQITQGLVANQTNKVKITHKGGTFFLEKIIVKQYVDIVNYGISGWSYRATLHSDNFNQLVEDDDDLIIVQLGTNDRTDTVGGLKSRIIEFVDKCHERNKEVILISSCDSLETRLGGGRTFEMETVRNIIYEVSILKNCAFIDNYNAINDYVMTKGIEMNVILPDKLHPNDEGYRVFYSNIAKSLGLPSKVF